MNVNPGKLTRKFACQVVMSETSGVTKPMLSHKQKLRARPSHAEVVWRIGIEIQQVNLVRAKGRWTLV